MRISGHNDVRLEVVGAHECAFSCLEERHRCGTHGLLEVDLGASFILIVISSLSQIWIAGAIDTHFVHCNGLRALRASNTAEARGRCLIKPACEGATEALDVHIPLKTLLRLLLFVLVFNALDQYGLVVRLATKLLDDSA